LETQAVGMMYVRGRSRLNLTEALVVDGREAVPDRGDA
jgi:hypothetical protein